MAFYLYKYMKVYYMISEKKFEKKNKDPLGQISENVAAIVLEPDTIQPKPSSPKTEELPLDSVIADPNQPRKAFDAPSLVELAESIKKQGLLQPILVRPIDGNKFQLVCGERRLRACKSLDLKTIKAEIRKLTNDEVAEIQLIENLQREDLNPIEEAEALQRILERGYTQEQAASMISKSREYVTNKLRLLKLHPETIDALRTGAISEGHARALVSIEENKQPQFVDMIERQRLNVRQTEKLVKVRLNHDVSRETMSPEMLIPIPLKTYNLLVEFAQKIKSKPDVLVVKAVLTYIGKTEVKQ